MNSESKFWLAINAIFWAGILAFTLTISSCIQNQSRKVQELVKMGTNPIAAKCAIVGVDNNEALCLEAARAK